MLAELFRAPIGSLGIRKPLSTFFGDEIVSASIPRFVGKGLNTTGVKRVLVGPEDVSLVEQASQQIFNRPLAKGYFSLDLEAAVYHGWRHRVRVTVEKIENSVLPVFAAHSAFFHGFTIITLALVTIRRDRLLLPLSSSYRRKIISMGGFNGLHMATAAGQSGSAKYPAAPGSLVERARQFGHSTRVNGMTTQTCDGEKGTGDRSTVAARGGDLR